MAIAHTQDPRLFSCVHSPLSQVHKVSQPLSAKSINHASQSQWWTTTSCPPPGSTAYLTDYSYLHCRRHHAHCAINTNDPKPYHTSILSGQGWVEELLEGHPGCICCELGVNREVFLELVSVLCHFGFGSSRYVDIEEQLTIFLYMSVTGLTIQHTGERFQQSNDTISKFFHHMLGIFSTEPFYTMYINLPNAHTPLSWRIHNNLKMSPFFDHALGTLNGFHITCAPPSYSIHHIGIERVSFHKTGFSPVTLIFNLFFCYTRWEGSAMDAQVL